MPHPPSVVEEIVTHHYLTHDHPILVIDLQEITRSYHQFKHYFPTTEVHYALKSFTSKEVASALYEQGCSFEIASINELFLLQQLMSSEDLRNVYYSNPVRSIHSIRTALKYGIRLFSVDSIQELCKLGNVADEMHIDRQALRPFLRIAATSKNSVWSLSKKFGASEDQAKEIISNLKSLHMKFSGFAFHVGSQCLDPEAWGNAVQNVDRLIDLCGDRYITDDILVNLGGGFPSNIDNSEQFFRSASEKIFKAIALSKHHHRFKLAAEPGRFLASSSGTLATRVISTMYKDGNCWAFVDAGIFHGMQEAYFGVVGTAYMARHSQGKASDISWTLAGPTCDSTDILPMKITLPSNLEEGDVIYFNNMGAYSSAYNTGHAETFLPGFNGFFPPSIRYI